MTVIALAKNIKADINILILILINTAIITINTIKTIRLPSSHISFKQLLSSTCLLTKER